MTSAQLAKLKEHDKRIAAVHEAGHAVVLLLECPHVRIRPWIRERDCDDPSAETTWEGHVEMFTWKPVRKNSVRKNSVIAVAGIVAEWLAEDGDVSSDEIMEMWDGVGREPSPADLAICSPNWRIRQNAVEQALDLLRGQKLLFDRIVLELLEEESITDGQMAGLAGQFQTIKAKKKGNK